METEAETGGMWLLAQGRLEPLELEETGRPLPGACGRGGAPGCLDLRHLLPRMGEGEFVMLPFVTGTPGH